VDVGDLADLDALVLYGHLPGEQAGLGGHGGRDRRIPLERAVAVGDDEPCADREDEGREEAAQRQRTPARRNPAGSRRRPVRAGAPAGTDRAHEMPNPGTEGSMPHRAKVSTTSATPMVRMLVRSARPAARPTPSGPPDAWN